MNLVKDSIYQNIYGEKMEVIVNTVKVKKLMKKMPTNLFMKNLVNIIGGIINTQLTGDLLRIQT